MEFLLILVLVVATVAAISAPLWRDAPAPDQAGAPDLPALHAARDAKYREIREAELDHRTGKLSDADWEAIDAQLRAEALAILRDIDGLAGPGR